VISALGLQFRHEFLAGAPIRLVGAFPASNNHCGQTVPQDVYDRAGHIHQLIDAEQKEDGIRGQVEGRGNGQYNEQETHVPLQPFPCC
jgi:hypothetical protein